MSAMWSEACESVIRAHPGVVAVYQSRRGDVALLLAQTLVPLVEERIAWLAETQRTAHAAIAALRAIGVRDPIVVVQWRSPRDAERIMTRWTLCYDGDPERREQLEDSARARVLDERVCPRRGEREPCMPVEAEFISWYRDMAPSWLAATPATRRRLILCTHRWIVERVVAPLSRGEPPRVDDLGPGGRLSCLLMDTIAPDEMPAWRSWIELVRADLSRALAWPPARRSSRWLRWLFLIPYSIPVHASCRGELAGSSPA